jgi:hypothetical protein
MVGTLLTLFYQPDLNSTFSVSETVWQFRYSLYRVTIMWLWASHLPWVLEGESSLEVVFRQCLQEVRKEGKTGWRKLATG